MSCTKDLIEALLIVDKYLDSDCSPTECEHGVLYLTLSENQVSSEDADRLRELGFSSNGGSYWHSYEFGGN